MLGKSAITSHSLGRAWVHDLESKLDAAQKWNHDIELFYEDIEHIAKKMPGGPTPDNLVVAAAHVRSLCEQRNIRIISLQPFMHYEGLRDRARHDQRMGEMVTWIEIALALRIDHISLPSSFLPADEISGDLELIVADFRELAYLGALFDFKFSYEALCWGTHVNTWEQAWAIVQAVDRPNFGLCLDTFNMAGKVFADPAAPSGTTPNAMRDLEASLERLRRIDVAKVFSVQVVDAERLNTPLVEGHSLYHAEQPARMSWSRNCRLFYGEQNHGGYLPIRKIMHVIFNELGFRGPISAEVFHACLTDADAMLPDTMAHRAALSWKQLQQDLAVDAASERNCAMMAHL